jgi:hypothetical protein
MAFYKTKTGSWSRNAALIDIRDTG